MKMTRSFNYLWALCSVSAMLVTRQVLACPNCKDAMQEGGGNPSGAAPMTMADGYSWSVIFMLAIVCSLNFAVVTVIYKLVQAEKAREAAKTRTTPAN